MNDSILTIPKPRSALDFGILVLIVKTILSMSSMWYSSGMVDNILTAISVVLLVAHIQSKQYNTRQLVAYAIVTVLFGVICINIGSAGLLITVITCLAVRDEDIERVVRFIFKYEFWLISIHCLVGAVSTLLGSKYYVLYHGYIRYSLGFGHANVLSAFVFNLVIMYFWLKFESLNSKDFIAVIIVELLLYRVAKTRTSLYLSVFVLLIVMIYKNKERSKLIDALAKYAVPILSLFTFVMTFLYEKGNLLSHAVDQLLTRRIGLASYAYNRLGLTIFGRDMRNFTTTWDEYYGFSGGFTFDNIYSYLLINVGIVILLLIIVVFYKVAKQGSLKNNIFILVWALYSMTEVHGLSCYMCFPILLAALVIPGSYRARERRNAIEPSI
ncbi:hypothetical protein DRA4_0408 [Lactococcus lactis subsp. lactis bv. diacetylactis]|uniref:hypothetical protein n=1 Tax=Lactococcus lactis TaxID=1358 RepID=UPI0007AE6749|nr:hypothetical protein [Lactococcus lactis]KZK13898.1 hypothetical protein DRA4_0408 [Lactococcus lactis subsp. lactis bv. diacetylactis]